MMKFNRNDLTAISLTNNNLNRSVANGVRYLQQLQRPSGEFPTYFSPHLDMSGSTPYKKSIYMTTFVMHALAHLPPSPMIKEMRQRAADFLKQEQEESGAWNYEGRGDWRVPADLDDTSCAVAALAELDQRPELSFYALLWQNESAPGGPYYTWLGINEREDDPRACEVDPLVNANIVYCCGLLNLSLPNTVYYLEQVIHAEAYDSESTYNFTPHLLIYALSRAYADGNVTTLEAAMSVMQDYILSKLPAPHIETSAFHLACLTVSLINISVPSVMVRPYLVPLLTMQRPDGSWPAWATYVGFAPDYDGSPALTTALALEALGKYILK